MSNRSTRYSLLASEEGKQPIMKHKSIQFPVISLEKKKTAKPTCTRTFLLRLLLDVHGRLNPDRLKRVPALPALDTSPPAGRGKAKKINNKTSQAVDGCCCYHTLYTSACHQLFQPGLFEVLLLRFSFFSFSYRIQTDTEPAVHTPPTTEISGGFFTSINN